MDIPKPTNNSTVIVADVRVGCYDPVGPAPTPAEEREMDHRIRSAQPLIRPAVFALLKMKRKETAGPLSTMQRFVEL